MDTYTQSHLSDQAVLHEIDVADATNRSATARFLTLLAEVDARKLYVPLAYSSTFAYCVGHFHYSEDEAFRRIRAARAGRSFPLLFPAISQGKLNLTAVGLLAP